VTALAVLEGNPDLDRRPRVRRPDGRLPDGRAVAGPAGAAFLLGLQRTAGNAAVARHLARTAPVQRCGPTPCDCSPQERAEYAADHPEEAAAEPQQDEAAARPVQRQAAGPGPAPRLVLQRLTDPLGADMQVDWTTTGANVALTDRAGANQGGGGALNFAGGDNASFTMPDRTASANLTVPVTANWHGKGTGPVPPGPQPGKECDACKVLIEGATVGTCAFVADVIEDSIQVPGLDFLVAKLVQGACIPIVAALGGSIDLLPKEILAACKSSNIEELINKIREFKENLDKNPTIVKIIDTIIDKLKKVPGLGQVAKIADIPRVIRAQISKRLGELIEKLKELRDKCRKGGQPVPAGGQGQATSTMKTMVFLGPDGQVRAVGPGPAQVVSGTGASEESPVRFSQDGVPNAALVTQVPTIVAGGENPAKAGHQFTVNVLFGLPPEPRKIDCPPAEFFPFKVAKDQFEDELAAQKAIRDWFFGHDPQVRDTVHTGESVVKITGRASKTGKVEFNRTLADKRAKRTEAIVRNFAGSDSSLRIFSTGFLTAQEPGEAGHERRSEAAIEGQVPADKVALMTGDPCVGHNAENADQGPTGPQVSPLPDLAGPGSPAAPAAPAPATTAVSTGEPLSADAGAAGVALTEPELEQV